jgi:hypothetical protein
MSFITLAEKDEILPRLFFSPEKTGNDIIFQPSEQTLQIVDGHLDPAQLIEVFRWFDGVTTLSELTKKYPECDPRSFHDLLEALEFAGACNRSTKGISGLEAALRLEVLFDSLTKSVIPSNPFWNQCLAAKSFDDMPRNVVIGMILENYHFLFRESFFDAPVLSFMSNKEARLAMNRFYAEEYGHDELLLQALIGAGIDRAKVSQILPLSSTIGFCNALAHWSHTDPLFSFATLGFMEGGASKSDSFIDCCDRIGVEKNILDPVKRHAEINIAAGHGRLTREILSCFTTIDKSSFERMMSKTYLFVKIYDKFYRSIWEHYSSQNNEFRTIARLYG